MKAEDYLDDLLELQEFHKGLPKLSDDANYLISELMTSIVGMCEIIKEYEDKKTKLKIVK